MLIPFWILAIITFDPESLLLVQRISLHLEHLRVNSVTTPICFIHVEYVVTERGVPSQVKSAVYIPYVPRAAGYAARNFSTLL